MSNPDWVPKGRYAWAGGRARAGGGGSPEKKLHKRACVDQNTGPFVTIPKKKTPPEDAAHPKTRQRLPTLRRHIWRRQGTSIFVRSNMPANDRGQHRPCGPRGHPKNRGAKRNTMSNEEEERRPMPPKSTSNRDNCTNHEHDHEIRQITETTTT